MRKNKRGSMAGRGGAARNDAVSLPPELPASVPALPVAKSSASGTVWEPPELVAWAAALPARAKVDISRAIAEPPELPEPVPPRRVSPVTVASDAGVWVPPDPAVQSRPRLVFGIDMTASRQPSIEPAKRLQDVLLRTLPGKLEVALAAHGGEEVHTFTPFTSNPERLRDLAAGLRCRGGKTQLLEILRRALKQRGVRCVVYVGDMFEESSSAAAEIAGELAERDIRVIVLHDTSLRNESGAAGSYDAAGAVFGMLAERTDGAVLPFDISALEELAKLLEAVAVLAVGGTEMLATQEPVMPAATLLLEHLGSSKALTIRRS
jgi:hypothetical protein